MNISYYNSYVSQGNLCFVLFYQSFTRNCLLFRENISSVQCHLYLSSLKKLSFVRLYLLRLWGLYIALQTPDCRIHIFQVQCSTIYILKDIDLPLLPHSPLVNIKLLTFITETQIFLTVL